jgi:hypothetical protein
MLVVCDVHIARKAWDQGKRCLRRLDVLGLIPKVRAAEITNRLAAIEKAMLAPP